MASKKKAPKKAKPEKKPSSKTTTKETEVVEVICKTCGEEVASLLMAHEQRWNRYIVESTSQSVSVNFTCVINRKKTQVTTKTSMSFSQINKDSEEHTLEDPDQLQLESVNDEARTEPT